jgi:iron(III) transport system substrate-binding protein
MLNHCNDSSESAPVSGRNSKLAPTKVSLRKAPLSQGSITMFHHPVASPCRVKPSVRLRCRLATCAFVVGVAVAAFPGTAAHAQSNGRAVSQTQWAQILADAKKEGRVVVYTTTAPAVHDRIKADFEKAFPGIEMDAVRIVGNLINTRVEQERAAGNIEGDAIITSELVWSASAVKRGLLRIPVGPNAQAWPASGLYGDGVPLLGVNPFVLVYNTNLVKTPPTGYQDLLKPEFKGRIGSTALLGDLNVGWYEWMEKTQGAGFLAKLAAQNVKTYPGAVPPTQGVAAGELSVNMWTVFSVTNPLLEAGAPIKTVVVNPSYGAAYGGGVVAGSKRPNAALVFMDYMMSVRGQSQMVGNGEMASALANVPGSLDIKSVTLHDYDKWTPDAVNAFKVKWNALFSGR